MLYMVPADFPFDARKVKDLKVKDEKKFASGCCAALVLTACGALQEGPIARVWNEVPREPDPKYDDISDQMWNAIAFWAKGQKAKPRSKRVKA